jgi:hypothetical protein
MGKAFARPDCELQTGLQVEEGHRAMLELRADDAWRFQAKPVAIEPQRALEIVDPDSDESDSRLHAVM